MDVLGDERVKTRGGRKKRKKPRRAHRDEHDGAHRNNDQGEPEFRKLSEPLRVTSDDSEEAVAKELAEKLNEVKYLYMLQFVSVMLMLYGI